jgi:hypothetical protein
VAPRSLSLRVVATNRDGDAIEVRKQAAFVDVPPVDEFAE